MYKEIFGVCDKKGMLKSLGSVMNSSGHWISQVSRNQNLMALIKNHHFLWSKVASYYLLLIHKCFATYLWLVCLSPNVKVGSRFLYEFSLRLSNDEMSSVRYGLFSFYNLHKNAPERDRVLQMFQTLTFLRMYGLKLSLQNFVWP
mgnify:CR=1 FL=1